MALQPYIIVTASDPNTLATNVVAQMANNYEPYGNPWSNVTYGSSITGTNKTLNGVESVNVQDNPANIVNMFYQAMILKPLYEYDYLYRTLY